MQVCVVISFLLLPQLVGLEVAFLWAALKVVCVCVCMGIKSVQITAHTHTQTGTKSCQGEREEDWELGLTT